MASSGGDMVPRALLDQANNAVQKLKKKLDETTQTGRKEMDTALRSMQMQLKTLQAQNKTGEEQFLRGMEREKDLRKKLEAAEKEGSSFRYLLKDSAEDLAGVRADLEQARMLEGELREELQELEAEKQDLLLQLQEEKARKDDADEVVKLRADVEALRFRLENETEDRAALVSALVKDAVQDERDRLHKAQEEVKGEVQRLQEECEQANTLLETSDEAARLQAGQVAELVKELTSHKRQLAEQQADLHAEVDRRKGLEETLRHLESRLEQEQDAALGLARRLEEKDARLGVLEEERGSDAKAQGREMARLNAKIAELQAELEEGKGEVSRVQEDGKRSREGLRDELRRAEVEAVELREKLRRERDYLEKLQKDHADALKHAADTRERDLALAAKREETLQRRMEVSERQVEGLRGTCVPEEALRQVREEAKKDKERYKGEVLDAQRDLERERARSHQVIERLEQRLSQAEEEATESLSRQRSLQQQLRQLEKQSRRERRQREFSQEQVKALIGDDDADAKNAAPKPSKLGAAVIESIDALARTWEACASKALLQGTARANADDQQTAVGILLSDAKVEATVPGSVAHLSGAFDQGDELLVVNGVAVEDGRQASAALRGDDCVGGVVSISLRKAATGEVMQIRLPRTAISSVNARQDLQSQLQLLIADASHSMAMSASGSGLASSHGGGGAFQNLAERIAKLADTIDTMDTQNLQIQLRLSEQIGVLKEGLDDLASRTKASVLSLDKAHVDVHNVQQQTERLMRVELARVHKAIMRKFDAEWDGEGDEGGAEVVEMSLEEVGGAEGRLHAQVMELQGAMRLLQEELGAVGILRREATQDAERADSRLAEMQQQLELLTSGNTAMRATVSRLEEQLSESLSEDAEHCWCVGLSLSCPYDEFVRDSTARASMETMLREELSLALEVPKGAVTVLCYCRGGKGLMAVVRLSSIVPSTLTGGVAALRRGREIAMELVRQVDENAEVLRGGDFGALTTAATVMGPISERTAQAMRAALVDRERDARSFEGELEEALARGAALEREKETQVLELQQQQQAMVVSFQAQMQALSEGNTREISRRVSEAKAAGEQALEEATRGLVREAEESARSLEHQYQQRLAETEASLRAVREEAVGLTQRLEGLEGELSRMAARHDELMTAVRVAEQDRSSMHNACEQVHHLLVPELGSCLTTVGNIESEMGFLNSYHLRALTLAEGGGGGEGPLQARSQVDRSTGLICHDVALLRSQLEALSKLSYLDPAVLSRQLQGTSSPSTTRGSSPTGSYTVATAGQKSSKDASPSSRPMATSAIPPYSLASAGAAADGPAGGDRALGGSSFKTSSPTLNGSGGSLSTQQQPAAAHEQGWRPQGQLTTSRASALRAAPMPSRTGSAHEVKMSIAQSLEKVGLASADKLASGWTKQPTPVSGASPYTQGIRGAEYVNHQTPAARALTMGTDRQGINTSISAAIGDALVSSATVKAVIIEARGLDIGGGECLQEYFVCATLLHSLSDARRVHHAVAPTDDIGAYRGGVRIKPQGRTHSSVKTANPKWEADMIFSRSYVLFPQIQNDGERAAVWGQRAKSLVPLDGRAPVTLLLTLHELDAQNCESLGNVAVRVKPLTASEDWHPLLDQEGRQVVGNAGVPAEIKVAIQYLEATPAE